jgi:hypothetical protein
MSNTDDGRTFEEIAAETLNAFGWQFTAADIPSDATVARVWEQLTAWWNRQEELTRNVIDLVDLSPGLEAQGFFAEWPACKQIFEGVKYGTNRETVRNASAALNNAFNRQFIVESETPAAESETAG